MKSKGLLFAVLEIVSLVAFIVGVACYVSGQKMDAVYFLVMAVAGRQIVDRGVR